MTTGIKGTVRFLVNENKHLGEPKIKRSFPERGGMKRDWSLEKKRLYLLEAMGAETAKSFASQTIKDLLDSSLTRKQFLFKLPKTYLGGKTIPQKKLEEFADVLGF